MIEEEVRKNVHDVLVVGDILRMPDVRILLNTNFNFIESIEFFGSTQSANFTLQSDGDKANVKNRHLKLHQPQIGKLFQPTRMSLWSIERVTVYWFGGSISWFEVTTPSRLTYLGNNV